VTNSCSSEKELLNNLAKIRKEIDALTSHFDVNGGAGFGGGESDERQLKSYIECKQHEEKLLTEILHHRTIDKKNKSLNIATWVAAVAALISAIYAFT
jgi:hypothetical protein